MKLFNLISKIVLGVGILSVTLSGVLAPTMAYAQNTSDKFPGADKLCGTSCAIGGNSEIDGSKTSIADLIIRVANFIVYILAALAVLFIVIGGLMYVTDTGNGKRAENGKKIVTQAVIGLIIAIAAGFVVFVITTFLQGNLLSGN
jgi:hypothetical protein